MERLDPILYFTEYAVERFNIALFIERETQTYTALFDIPEVIDGKIYTVIASSRTIHAICDQVDTLFKTYGIRKCLHCGAWIVQGSVCRNCVSLEESINNYSYKPLPLFHGASEFQIGAEIEVEVWNEDDEMWGSYKHAYAISKMGNRSFFYCKRDASIAGQGFEIVTHPFSLEYEREHGTMKELFNYLSLNDNIKAGRSDKAVSCGIHFHVSKEVATPEVMYRVAKFFVKNSDFITNISHRVDMQRFERFAKVKMPRGQLSIIRNDRRGSSHYCAIHRTEQTYEIRIFNSTRNYEEFMTYLEFVHGIISYYTGDIKRCNYSIKRLNDYMAKQGYEYYTKEVSDVCYSSYE